MPGKIRIDLKLEAAMEVKAAITETRDRLHAKFLVEQSELEALAEDFRINDDVDTEIIDEKADRVDSLKRRVALLSDSLLEF